MESRLVPTRAIHDRHIGSSVPLTIIGMCMKILIMCAMDTKANMVEAVARNKVGFIYSPVIYCKAIKSTTNSYLILPAGSRYVSVFNLIVFYRYYSGIRAGYC